MSMTQLGLVELDLLATHAGASIPFPLRVPSFGRIAGERDVLFAAAHETLQHRRLADEDGPVGVADEFARALAGRRGTVDLVLTGPDGPAGAVAILRDGHAMLCAQKLTEDDDLLVDVREVPFDGVVDALMALVPDVPAAKTMPIRLPTAALRAAHDLVASGTATSVHQLHEVVERHGGQADDLDTLSAATGAATGNGQVGATRVAGAGKDVRTGTELSWLDGPHGRVRVTDKDGWVSVNPLRPNDLRAILVELVALASRASEGSR